MIVILLGGVFLSKGEKKYGGLYILSVVGLLFSLLLVTPDFGDWNVNLFIFFNNHIPLFTIFRNMYDKFGIAVSFQFAFALFIALVILGEKIHRKSLRVLIILLLTGITVWNAHMYIFSDKSADGISGVFNEDYISLIGYVKSMNEASRFVWLPLNFSSYSVIEDAKNPGRFYYGSSPLQFLAETSDYTGFQSFATAADSDLNFQMLGLIHEKKYDEIGKILQRMNAKYIINYHYAIPKQFYNHMNFEGAIDQQASGMLNELKGEKIRDFGGRYTLYSINVKYHSEKIFLTDTFDTFPDTFTGLTFQKISPSRFDIVVNNQSELIHIAFLEPFDPLWQLSAVDRDGNLCHIPNLQQMMIYRYGNGWTVSKDALVNACPNAFQTNANENEMLSLRVTFKAEKYSSSVNIVSIVCWIIVVVYLVGVGGYSMIKHKKHGKK